MPFLERQVALADESLAGDVTGPETAGCAAPPEQLAERGRRSSGVSANGPRLFALREQKSHSKHPLYQETFSEEFEERSEWGA